MYRRYPISILQAVILMDNLPDHLRSPWPEWTLAELLGEGAFSTVWHAVCEASNGEAAIKALRIVPNEEDSESRIIMKSYEQEGLRYPINGLGDLDRIFGDIAKVIDSL